MTGIFKHKIELEVLSDAASLDYVSLETIAYEIMDGGWMGKSKVTESNHMSRDDLIDEAYKMGGEPSFFGEEFAD